MQIAEIDATDETAPYVAKTYRWDPSEPVATRPLALTLWTREGNVRETLYYAHDLRKNVVSLFDGKGLRRASYQYDPYGNITSMEGDMAEENPFRFSSEHHDEDLGLVYYNYRHYNPTAGRWTSRDPIAEKGGWNLYGFVGNMPIDLIDWLGAVDDNSMLEALEKSRLKARGPFPVHLIPDMMKKEKWLNGARLMNIWLYENKTCDDQTIKMDTWVLTYPRAKEAYDELAGLGPRVFTPQTLKLLKEHVLGKEQTGKSVEEKIADVHKRKNYFQPDFSSGAQKLDAYHLTHKKVGMSLPDDMGAALGSFALYLLLAGKQCAANCFCIYQIGIYAKDQYHFNDGDQYLGHWDTEKGFSGSRLFGERITNKNFRDYKKKTGLGSDFTVYSDIKVTTLEKPVKVCW